MIKSLEEFLAEQEQSLEIHKLKLRIAAALPEGCIAANIHGYGSQTQRTSVHYRAQSLIDAIALYESMKSITVPYAEYRGGYSVSVLPYLGLDARAPRPDCPRTVQIRLAIAQALWPGACDRGGGRRAWPGVSAEYA